MAIRVIPDYQWSTAISTWAINYIAGIHSLNILPVPVYCLRHIVHHEVFKTDLNPSTAPYSISLCAGSVINATFHYVMSTMALFHRQKALLSKQLAFLISTLIYREMTKGVQMWTVFPPFCVDVLIIGRELNMSSTDIVFRQNQLKIVPFPLTCKLLSVQSRVDPAWAKVYGRVSALVEEPARQGRMKSGQFRR